MRLGGSEGRDDATGRGAFIYVRGEVLHVIRRLRAAVEDLVQEVLLRLWTKSGGYAGGSVTAWLLRVATNLALNHRRGRARRQPQP